MCTRVPMYTIVLCTEGVIVNMCPYLLLLSVCVQSHWLGIFHYWCYWVAES